MPGICLLSHMLYAWAACAGFCEIGSRPFNHMRGGVEFDKDFQPHRPAEYFLSGPGFMITFIYDVPGISSSDVAGFVYKY